MCFYDMLDSYLSLSASLTLSRWRFHIFSYGNDFRSRSLFLFDTRNTVRIGVADKLFLFAYTCIPCQMTDLHLHTMCSHTHTRTHSCILVHLLFICTVILVLFYWRVVFRNLDDSALDWRRTDFCNLFRPTSKVVYWIKERRREEKQSVKELPMLCLRQWVFFLCILQYIIFKCSPQLLAVRPKKEPSRGS